MSTFQPKRCPTDFKFCSNWPQKVQYKACIPQFKMCYDTPKLYELNYFTTPKSCKKAGKGDVCPYSNYDWARLLNGFTVVDSCPPLKSDSVLSKKSSDAIGASRLQKLIGGSVMGGIATPVYSIWDTPRDLMAMPGPAPVRTWPSAS